MKNWAGKPPQLSPAATQMWNRAADWNVVAMGLCAGFIFAHPDFRSVVWPDTRESTTAT
jgi:hypothetical protein